ncbi:MAG: hypothetical protein JRE81_02280 [Deltaproteobacteria bacterium]|jgi:hypothetical protein|nr:hypothetical protein [Deltaproteobacteria bacterium]
MIGRGMQLRRGEFPLERPIQFAGILNYGLVALQLLNAVFFHEPWAAIAGLATYSFFGFGFFILLLLELLRPSAA